LPNNTIDVQALDANGAVLGQQTVTLDTQEMGGSGKWTTTLALSVAPGTAGQIVALAPPMPGVHSPAITTVPVVFGEAAPTAAPTEAPTAVPTIAPTDTPTLAPTVAPTEEPTETPTVAPTVAPTETPTEAPTVAPTAIPTTAPTTVPSATATEVSTVAPTEAPTTAPTAAPTTQPTAESTATPIPSPTATTENAATPTATLTPTEEPTAGAESTASITILQPADGTIVNPQQIHIAGEASGLPMNNLIVQALKADGTILSQVAALVSGNLGLKKA